MEITNLKSPGVTLICRFPPDQNLNIFSLTHLSGKLEFAKRNKFWIASTAILSYFVITFAQYRLSLGSWEPIETPLNYNIGDIFLFGVMGIVVLIIAALTFGRGAPSGRVRLTRSSAESVDGFGGARARDYSYGPAGHHSSMGLPVSLRQERERTATFREGAREYDDEDEKSE